MPSIPTQPNLPQEIAERWKRYSEADRNHFLEGKDYYRPSGNDALALGKGVHCQDGIDQYHDYIFDVNSITFILSQNKQDNIPCPSHLFFAVGNPKSYARGNYILLDTVDGKSAIRRIRQIDGRVIILDSRLEHLPMLGGDVLKIVGTTTASSDAKKSEIYNKKHR